MSKNKLCFNCLNQGFPCWIHDESRESRYTMGLAKAEQKLTKKEMLSAFAEVMIDYFNCEWWQIYKKQNHLRDAEYWYNKMKYAKN